MVPPGNTAATASAMLTASRNFPFDEGNEVHHLGIPVDAAVLGDVDGPILADLAEVIAFEVDQHGVFSPLLLVATEVCLKVLVFRWRRAARPRSGNRLREQLVAIDVQQQLRAGADKVDAGELKQG